MVTASETTGGDDLDETAGKSGINRNMEKYNSAKKLINKVFLVVTIGVLTALFMHIWFINYAVDNGKTFYQQSSFIILVIYVILLLLSFHVNEGDKIGFYTYSHTVFSQIMALICANGVMYLPLCLVQREMAPWKPLVVLTALQGIFSAFWCFIGDRVYHRLYPPHQILMVSGQGRHVNALLTKMSQRKDKYRITHWIDQSEGLEAILAEIEKYESVLICDLDINMRNAITKYCFENNIRLYICPRISDVIIRSAEDMHLFDTPLLLCRNYGLTIDQRVIKRGMDILFSVLGLGIVSPLYLVISLCIRLYDGGPVLYKQERLTRNGKPFYIYKFRSMIVDAEKNSGAVLAGEKDQRITPVGRFIRRFRLDELPQLINILKGEMSFVGPRPERGELAEQISQDIPEFSYRLKVKAGLTGLAQVIGKYNTSAYDKLELDLMYIAKYSVLLDLKIILMTPRMLFIKEKTEGVER